MLATSLTAAVLGVEAHLVARGGRHGARLSPIHDGRAARLRGEGERGPHPRRAAQLRLRVQVGPPHHRQPRAGEPAQGGLVATTSPPPWACWPPTARGRRRRSATCCSSASSRSTARAAGGRRAAHDARGAPSRHPAAIVPAPQRRRGRARRRNAASTPCASLPEAIGLLSGTELPSRRPGPRRPAPRCEAPDPDLADVRGQPLARRALEIAAAGGHNLLLVGPPGSGKTMLARRLPGILPALAEEAVETTAIHSAAGLRRGRGDSSARPFRSPHHTTSDAALVGGGHGRARAR